MKQLLHTSLVLFGLLTVLTGVVYPAVVTVWAQVLFPRQANGSLIEHDGQKIGSELIGQDFDDESLFWGRPSATSPTAYNAMASSGSNLGPSNPALLTAVEERVRRLRAAHPDQAGAVPVDLVTTSASGLDPHISVAAARYQARRVAVARKIAEDELLEIIALHTEGRSLGILGESRVNVMRLNLAVMAATRGH